MAEHLIRGTLLTDDAVCHIHHMGAHVPGEGHFVGDDQHGHALLGQLLHDGEDLAHHFRVQGGGGFIEEQHFRVHSQGPGDGHPLLLAAGYLPGLGVDVGGHAHLVQVFHGGSSGLFFIALQDLDLAHHTVFQYGHVVEEVEGLEYHAHMGPVFRLVDTPAYYILAVVKDLSGGGSFQQVDTAQERTLAGAGSTDDGGHVAGVDGKINIL